MQAPDLTNIYVLELGQKSPAEVQDTLTALRLEPDVLYAEENREIRVEYTPNDPHFSSDLYGLQRLNAPAAWDISRGAEIVVAIVDTGIDYNHPDILGNIWTNPREIADNGIDDDHNGYIDDTIGWDFAGHNINDSAQDNNPFDGHFHGTHVAGTVVAQGNNSVGIIGVAFNSRVMAVKGLDDTGAGNEITLVNAITYAVKQGADIINASWGGPGKSALYQDAVDYAVANGVVFIAAAGNNNIDAASFTPANIVSAITVSANDQSGQKAGFSNWGSKLDVSAPGVNILSLNASGADYAIHSGTSMAAPHASGVAALVLSLHPNYTVEQVRQVLRRTATDLGAVGQDSYFGYGEVNAARAVLALPPLEAKITAPETETRLMDAVSITGYAQGPTFARYFLEYGLGNKPSTWTLIKAGTTPVSGGALGLLDPATLPTNGLYIVRLRVENTTGASYSDQIEITSKYIAITDPTPPNYYSETSWRKSGEPIAISGRAKGIGFQSYRLEWALGTSATSNWSSTGMVLTNDGKSPVNDAILGTWTPPPALRGDVSLRLVIQNANTIAVTSSSVYLEPDLVSSRWPKFVERGETNTIVLPVKLANNTSRLIVESYYQTASHDFNGDTIVLPGGRAQTANPTIGNVDGLPGEEVVRGLASSIAIYSPTLTLLKTIPHATTEYFGRDRIYLADLDNDGKMEIISLASIPDTTLPTSVQRRLYVDRGDGQSFSPNYPVGLTPQSDPGPSWKYFMWFLLTVDLNGDGRREIIVAMPSWSNSDQLYRYNLLAFNSNGTPYQPWTSPSFEYVLGLQSHAAESPLTAADLDGDGKQEIIFTEVNNRAEFRSVVIDRTGQTLSGLPTTGGFLPTSTLPVVADLDGDQKSEIVWIADRTLNITRFNGGSSTVLLAPELSAQRSLNHFCVADIDSDGVPEIIYNSRFTLNGEFVCGLAAIHPDGSLVRQWRAFGGENETVDFVFPTLGDFNGDGKTDIACYISTAFQIGPDFLAFEINGNCALLTTDMTLNPKKQYWMMPERDPQGSRSIPIEAGPQPTLAAPVITMPADNIGVTQPTLSVSGTAVARSTVKLYRSSELLATTTATEAGTFQVNVSLAYGMNELTGVAQDMSGAFSPPSNRVRVTLDNKGPIISNVRFNNVALNPNSNPTRITAAGAFSADVIDDVSKIQRVVFKLSSAVVGEDSDGADGYSVSFNPSSRPNGQYYLEVSAWDQWGNLYYTPYYNVDVIGNLPKAPLISSPVDNTAVNQTTVNVVFTIDAGSTVKLSRGSTVVATRFSISGETAQVPVTLQAGINELTAIAENDLGSVGSSKVRVILDQESPTVSGLLFDGSAVPATISTNGTFSVQANDLISGVERVTFLLDGNILAEDNNKADGYTAPFVASAVASGPHSITAHAFDRAGNSAVLPAVSFAVLRTPAPPVFLSPANNSFVNQLVNTLSGTAEPNSIVTIYRGGGQVARFMSTPTGTFSTDVQVPGDVVFTATVSNAAGISAPSAPLHLTIDTVLPEIADVKFNNSSVPAVITVNGTFSVSAVDPQGAIKKVTFTLDGSLLQEDTSGADGYTAPFTRAGRPAGSHTLTIQATDRANNLSRILEVRFNL